MLWLGLILLVAGALRVVGLSFGFPLRVHPDEWAIVDNAVDLARRGSFDPTFFDRPDHLEIRLNFLVDSFYSWLRFQSPLPEGFAQHELSFVLIGRGISAVFGLGCVWIAYLIVRRFSVSAAIVAAALFALFPPLVLNAHYATPEAPQTFFLLLFIYAAVRYLEQPGLFWLIIAGALIGVGFTIKYPAVFLGVVLAMAVGVVSWRQRSWQLFLSHGVLSLAGLVAAIFVVSPVLLTDFGSVLAAIRQQGQPVHLGADGLGWTGNLAFYAVTFYQSAGPLLVAAAVVGAIWLLRNDPVRSLPLWTGLVYGLLLSAVALHWARWGVPMFVSPLMFAAIGIDVAARWLWSVRPASHRVVRIGLVAIVVTLIAVAGLNQLISAATTTAGLAATDTRVVGRQLQRSLGATKATTVYEGYTPYLPDAPWAVFADFMVVNGELRLTPVAPRRARLLVISSGMRSRYLADPRYVKEAQFYAAAARLPSLGTVSPVTVRSSSWELQNIWYQWQAFTAYVAGGYSGPSLSFYDLRGVAHAR